MKIVYKIIILNVVLWLANSFINPQPMNGIPTAGPITEFLSLNLSDVYKPWLYWRFLTYGFVHDPTNAWHLIGNMLGLFFLGRYVEERYGSKQFLGFYLASIVFGGVFWVFCSWMSGDLSGLPQLDPCLLGASGGVTATVILFAVTYPRVTLVLFPIPIPMPAWLFGLLLVGSDMFGAVHLKGSNVAYTVHLSAAAFAAAYYFLNWNFTRLGALFMGDFRTAFQFKSTPKVHYNDERYDDDDNAYLFRSDNQNKSVIQNDNPRNYAQREKDARLEAELADEADRILRKISQTGRDSLTRAEERTLQTYSELLQRKKR